jgi:hypothetical protein
MPGARWWGEAAVAAAAIAVLLSGPSGTDWTWGLATVLAAGLAGKLAGRLAGRLLLGLRGPRPAPVGGPERTGRLQDALS